LVIHESHGLGIQIDIFLIIYSSHLILLQVEYYSKTYAHCPSYSSLFSNFGQEEGNQVASNSLSLTSENADLDTVPCLSHLGGGLHGTRIEILP
jgi:hypothetical protein